MYVTAARVTRTRWTTEICCTVLSGRWTLAGPVDTHVSRILNVLPTSTLLQDDYGRTETDFSKCGVLYE